jgi:PAS domain S-box-containing protein
VVRPIPFFLTSSAARYGAAAGVAAVSVAIAKGVEIWTGTTTFSVALAGVVIAAALGGIGPALLATLLSGLGMVLLVIPPSSAFRIEDRNDLIRWTAFLASGLVLVWFAERARRAHRSEREARLRAEEIGARLDLALDAGRMGTWSWDAHSGRVEWSPQLEAIHGLPPGGFEGTMGAYLSRIHPDDRDTVEKEARASLDWRGRHDIEHRIVREDGGVRWIWGRGEVLRDRAGRPSGLAGIAMDVTERRLAEQRQELLARVADEVASPLGVEARLQRLAGLMVPALADLCYVQVTAADGLSALSVIAGSHGGSGSSMDAPVNDAPVTIALRRPVHVRAADPETLRDLDRRGLLLPGIRDAPITSYIAVPLVARGRTIGALGLATAPESGRLELEHLSIVEQVARRAAIAIDNARLYERQREIAMELQGSLLPSELPAIPGIELAASYAAAGEGIEVGGDFYDVFPTGEDSWTAVVGDVCGKGPEAASLTALARYTIRAGALREGAPREIITHLNEAILSQRGDGRFLTLACACLEIGEEGPWLRAVVARAGHPPPLVVRASGFVERVEGQGTIVGVFPEIEVAQLEIELGPGDALVLYTDGLIEARSERELYGIERLEEALGACVGLAADQMVDHVARDVGSFRAGPATDDHAVLVIRPCPPPRQVRRDHAALVGEGVSGSRSPEILAPGR